MSKTSLDPTLKKKRSFAEPPEKVLQSSFFFQSSKTQNDTHSTWNDFADNDDDPLMGYDDRDSSESESDDDVILDEMAIELALRILSSSSPERDHMNIFEKNLPPYAAQILGIITRCKKLCCYVKRVTLKDCHNRSFLFIVFLTHVSFR